MAEKQILPVAIIGKADVIRLKRELEELDDAMHQHRLRKEGKASTLPKLSPQLEELSEAMKTNLNHIDDRQKLISLMDKVIAGAPSIHVSFATNPSPAFLQKIVKWFREEVHQTLLVQVGLQPSIAAGCVVRTSNKQFDLSLRQFFNAKQEGLIESIRGKHE